MRHVVGGTQMKLPQYLPSKLPMLNLWVSMIENWGEVNKEFNHYCDKGVKLQVCVVKLSKYFWRTLSAMKELGKYIPPYLKKGLIEFTSENPEAIMDHWLQTYKRQGLNEIDESEIERKRLRIFFTKFGCLTVAKDLSSFTRKCLESINQLVVKYTTQLSIVLPLQTGRIGSKL